MIANKQMEYIKSEDGLEYYIFTPTIWKLYYDDHKSQEGPAHRKSISHKLHMLLYILRGGYKILYMTKNSDVVSYIIYTHSGRSVIKNTSKKDIYSIFVWTYPEYRKKGYASKIVHEMLHGIGLKYRASYKTILSDNIGSIKSAKENGYECMYGVKRTKFLKTAYRADDIDDYHLYRYIKGMDE